MSALLHPIHGAREKCRPKHQVLVLRCYPKFQKNVQEVKPNSSELSYLLYYASSRRTKLQKVGSFLEKKTASDVWRQKLGNVQVTLQILTSIIEKAPRDLALYAGSVLTVLSTVLGSKDVNMIEESIETFESYCRYADAASLSADQSRLRQYLSIIQQYAAFGSTNLPKQPASQSTPSATRCRNIALKAVRAVVGSDALTAETKEQLDAVMPLILENLDLQQVDGLAPLQQKATHSEKHSVELARRRRMSTVSISNLDEAANDPSTAAETTADADKQAEEDVRVLAVRCLKQIFSVSTGTSRTQLRIATALVLRHIATKERPQNVSPLSSADSTSTAPDWATTLFETIARWTPVQDRFIIVIVTVEALVTSPILESVLEKQLVLARLVDWLLRSDINLIGLSVMDVLLRLIQHMLLLLQLGDRDGPIASSQSRGETLGLLKDLNETFDYLQSTAEPGRTRSADVKESSPSTVRKELLSTLQKCIVDLATHIYYTDQISDMLTAILVRLKPSTTSEIPTAIAAVNDPAGATKAIADSAGLQDDPSTDRFFSFVTARVVALKAIKGILQTANSRRTSTGTSAEVRSRVGVQVWDNTQWLLKDEDAQVQVAYVDALLTWLRLETNRSDLLLPSDGSPRKSRALKRETINANGEMSVAKRAVSNASKRGEKQKQSNFLQLLHLAIFDNAVEHADNDASMQLLHLLLWTQVERLGVNSIRTGLPMILNLQGTVLNANDHDSTAKTRVASLVHGYLWAVIDKFDFTSSTVGAEVNAEISRRRQMGCWFDKIKFPPSSIAHITAPDSTITSSVSDDAAGTLRPFLNVDAFVEEIATSYDKSLASPTTSPPSSPGRVFSIPTLGFGYGYTAANVHKPSPENQMPARVKEEMCGTWSRDACIAAADKENNPSLAGSRTAPSSNGRQYLSAGRQNGTSNPSSPLEATNAQAPPLFGGLGSLNRAREISTHSSLREPDTSSRDSTTRVADLKRALSGANGAYRNHSPLRRPMSRSRTSTHSSGSESMLSWNPADDDSVVDGETGPSRPHTSAGSQKVGGSVHDRVTSKQLNHDIPPVPPIPSALNLPMAGTFPRDTSPHNSETTTNTGPEVPTSAAPVRPTTTAAGTVREKRHRPASRAGGASVMSYSTAGRKADLSALLANIQVDDPTTNGETRSLGTSGGGGGGLLKPPY